MEKDYINEQHEQAADQPLPRKRAKATGFAGLLGRFDSVGESGIKRVFLNVPFLLFLIALGVLHIANNHMAVSMVRKIAAVEKEVKELRWKYMTTSSMLIQKSRQSEVAKLVKGQGLKELREPPLIIQVPATNE